MTASSIGRPLCALTLLLPLALTAPADTPRHSPDGQCVRDWLLLGPFFPDALDRDFLASAGGETQASPKEGDTVIGSSGNTLTWQQRQSRTDVIDLNALLGPQERATAYAFCLIESDRPTVGTLKLGSDDGASVFLNGRRILHRPVNRGFLLDEDIVPIHLNQGANRLLVKVSQGVAAWEFSTRVEVSDAALVSGVVADRKGRPLGGSLVTLFRDGRRAAAVRADAAGHFGLSLAVREGTYALSAIHDTLGAWKTNVHLEPGRAYEAPLILTESVAIQGRVRTRGGKRALAGVPVQALRDGDLEQTTLTDDEGRYRLVNLLPGRVQVCCLTPRGRVDYSPPEDKAASRTLVSVTAGAVAEGIDFYLTPPPAGTWGTLTTFDGLPDRLVNCIASADSGMVWIGTRSGGICRYDGRSCEVFGEDAGLASNTIHALLPDPDGGVWAGTDGGLAHLEGRRFRVFSRENSPQLPSDQVFSLLRDRTGRLWIGTANGICSFDGTRFRAEDNAEGALNGPVPTLCEATNGDIWIGSSRGVFIHSGSTTRRLANSAPLPSNRVSIIRQGPDGSLWIGTDAGLTHLANGTARTLTTEDGLVSDRVLGLAWTSNGTLWITTDGGVTALSSEGIANFSSKDGPLAQRVGSCCVGAGDIVWFGADHGVVRFDPGSFENFGAANGLAKAGDDNLSTAGVFSVLPRPNGDIWLGTEWGGLFESDGAAFVQLLRQPQRYVRKVVVAQDGTAWLGTDNGLVRWDRGNAQYVASLSWVLALSRDDAGNLWFGNGWKGNGLFRYNPATGATTHFTKTDGLPSNQVWALAPYRPGQMLIGTVDGLALFDGQRIRAPMAQRLPGMTVWTICYDPTGVLWWGGASGVYRYDGTNVVQLNANGLFRLTNQGRELIRREPKLPDNQVWAICRTPDGIVWFGTSNHGLVGYDGTALVSIDTRDGLAGNSVMAIAPDANGYLWVGTTDGGLTRFRKKSVSPGIRILQTEVDEKPVKAADDQTLHVTSGQHLSVNYQEIDQVTHPNKRQFRLRVTGADGKILRDQVTPDRRFDWTLDRPGRFVVAVQAIDRYLNRSPWQSLALVVNPAWYARAWVAVPSATALTALLASSVLLATRNRSQRREAARLRDQMLAQEREKNLMLSRSFDEIKGAKRAADEANAAKSRFLANMSHEIRTPMNAVLGYAQIMERSPELDPSLRQPIDAISRSGRHLLRLIDGILDLSKIEAGRTELEAGDFDLRGLIEEMSIMFDLRCREKRLRWRVDFPGDQPAPVHGDEGKLRQVLINLLGNAVKFTDAGEIRLDVNARDQDRFEFKVVDTGCGIPPEEQQHVFEVFQQGAAGAARGGTGLGLAITSKQVEMMGGHVRLVSQTGVGSEFSFTLPLPPARSTVTRPRPATAPRVPRLKAGRLVNALVADDVAENRDLLSRFLTGAGVTTATAADGREALAELARRPFDIVFMDIRMPVLDGLAVIRAIRNDERLRRLKVVVVTASSLLHERQRYLAEGFDAFLPKPIDAERLFALLPELLGVEYDPAPSCAETATGSLQARSVRIESKILDAVEMAAEISDVSALRNLLNSIEAAGANGAWMRDLREAAQRYDMDAVRKAVTRLRERKPEGNTA